MPRRCASSGVAISTGAPSSEIVAAIGARRAGQNARERALAGAVFAHEGVHFAGAEVEIRAFEGVDAAVVFGDPYRLEVARTSSIMSQRGVWELLAGTPVLIVLNRPPSHVRI